MQRLFLLGLNHTTAPLEVREKLAFNPQEQQRALEAFRERFPECEALLLSTCNRAELYTARPVHGHPRVEEMIDFLADFRGVSRDSFQSYLYQKSERDVVEHLFAVASSLDSMVLGETQILGQVREAYELASTTRSTGGLLNPLFQKALAVGKEILASTPLAEGRISIASVAVTYARRIFENFSDKTVLTIGAGKMAQLVLRHFADLKPGKLLVCNRDAGKADALAGACNGISVDFARLVDHLTAADVVVTSTGSAHPIITRAMFDGILKARRYRPVFLIDIALPRDVEAGVGELQSVYLYNLDDLQQVVAETHANRQDSTVEARRIVAGHVAQFAMWHRAREMGPVIDELSQRYHSLAREELQRTLGKLPDISETERSHLEDLTRRIVNKLLHDPIKRLREADGLHQPVSQYVHALEKLFALDAPSGAALPSQASVDSERSDRKEQSPGPSTEA